MERVRPISQPICLPDCRGLSPTAKSNAIFNFISSWSADVVTLQEICHSTFDKLLARLGRPWTGYFATTVLFSDDNRCDDPGQRSWGIAVVVRGTIGNYDNRYIGNDPDDGEVRRFLCGDVSIGAGQRACTTHLTPFGDSAAEQENYDQYVQVRSQVNSWAVQGVATSLGADLNRDVRACNQSILNSLEEIYRGQLGPRPSCVQDGRGQFYEADHFTSSGDGTYDEATFASSKKIDYFFVNYQRFYADYGGDAVPTSSSDHNPLRAAVTVHSP